MVQKNFQRKKEARNLHHCPDKAQTLGHGPCEAGTDPVRQEVWTDLKPSVALVVTDLKPSVAHCRHRSEAVVSSLSSQIFSFRAYKDTWK
nr:hypothetical protein Iba_chr07bCG15370 [Ipomoea batatas]